MTQRLTNQYGCHYICMSFEICLYQRFFRYFNQAIVLVLRLWSKAYWKVNFCPTLWSPQEMRQVVTMLNFPVLAYEQPCHNIMLHSLRSSVRMMFSGWWLVLSCHQAKRSIWSHQAKNTLSICLLSYQHTLWPIPTFWANYNW